MIQNAAESLGDSIAIAYRHIHGTLFCGNSLIWLTALPDESAELISMGNPTN